MINFIQFTLTRAGLAVITLLLVCFIVFSLMELVPGTCAERYLAFKNTQGSQITYEDIEKEKIRLGLDKPFLYRYGKWVSNIVFNGDFGDSCILRMSINDFDMLRKDLSKIEFINASKIIWELRMIKSHNEIKKIKKIISLTSNVFDNLPKKINIGMSEIEL